MKKILIVSILAVMAIAVGSNRGYAREAYSIGVSNVRESPSLKSRVIFAIGYYPNAYVEVLSRKGDFYYIRDSHYGYGWTHVSNISFPRFGYPQGECNVRQGPSAKSRLMRFTIGTKGCYGYSFESCDDEVQVLFRKGSFYYIYAPGEGRGYGWTHVSNIKLGKYTYY